MNSGMPNAPDGAKRWMPNEKILIAQMEQMLRLEENQLCPELEWLYGSYRSGAEFWHALKNAFDDLMPVQTGSSIFRRYNLYHDFVLRHINSPAPAMMDYSPETGFKHITYRELHERALEKSSLWREQGVEPQHTVCVVRSLEPELLVELAALLQIGCRASFLLPEGRRFLQKNVELLAPEHISIHKKNSCLLSGALQEKILTEEGKEHNRYHGKGTYFQYAPEQTVFAVLDFCAANGPIWKDLRSDTVYLGALRDGLIALGLRPGQKYAAPGFHFSDICPMLLLAGLFCGASYLHMSPKDIQENPQVVVENQISAFGVSRVVRNILMEKPVEVESAWQTWFRNPAESADLDQWRFFSQSLKLTTSYAFNLRWNAPAGGCTLFSVRRKGTAHSGVLPSFAMNWQLLNPSATEESLSDFGQMAVLPPGVPEDDEKMTNGDMIAGKGNEWLFIGAGLWNREGESYPSEKILETLEEAFPRIAFSLVAVPQADAAGDSRIILMVFHGADEKFSGESADRKIREIILQEMGPRFQPDKIAFLFLFPRWTKDGKVDHEWCRDGLFTGDLHRKGKDEICRNLTTMRSYLLQKALNNQKI